MSTPQAAAQGGDAPGGKQPAGAPYKLLGRFEVESPEWYAARQNRLGGSEIAAVLGLSPYESRFSLWHRKKGLVGPQQMNPEMDWGRRLESAVLAKYAENHPGRYSRGGAYVSAEREYQVSSPDMLLLDEVDEGVLKIIDGKTSPFGEGWGTPGTDQMPVYIRCQLLWYMDVFGVSVADIALLTSGCNYAEYTLRREDSEIQILRHAGVEFIASLNADERPDIDGHDQTYHVIKELHPEIDGSKVDLDPDLVEHFIESRKVLDVAESSFRLYRNLLAEQMGDAKAAYCNGFKIADRRVKGEGKPYIQSVSAKQLPTLEQLRTVA